MKDGARAPSYRLGFLIEALAEVLRNKQAEGAHSFSFLGVEEITVLRVIRLILAFSIKVSKTKKNKEKFSIINSSVGTVLCGPHSVQLCEDTNHC